MCVGFRLGHIRQIVAGDVDVEVRCAVTLVRAPRGGQGAAVGLGVDIGPDQIQPHLPRQVEPGLDFEALIVDWATLMVCCQKPALESPGPTPKGTRV